MDLLESVSYAAKSVLGNKTRSLLTVLGVVIGICSVVMISSIGSGFKKSLAVQLDRMGIGSIQISVDYSKAKASDLLTMDDWEAAASHPEVESSAPLYETSGKASLKNPTESASIRFMGTTREFKDIQFVDMLYGSFITDADVKSGRKAVVIESALAEKAFGKRDAVGETLLARIRSVSVPMTVIGVYKGDSFSSEIYGETSIAYAPATTMMKLDLSSNPDAIFVSATERGDIARISKELTKLISVRHGNSNAVVASNLLDQMDAANGMVGDAAAFVSLIAAISLVVGGIGVMNIMLATVTERTREIGIRKSLGATEGSIQLQFLIEAVILTLAGGSIGIVLGTAFGALLGNAIGIPAEAGLSAVATAVLVSCATGAVFGVYPARKAAKMDPVEALRYGR